MKALIAVNIQNCRPLGSQEISKEGKASSITRFNSLEG